VSLTAAVSDDIGVARRDVPRGRAAAGTRRLRRFWNTTTAANGAHVVERRRA